MSIPTYLQTTQNKYNKNAGRNTLYTHGIELTFKRYLISSTMRPSKDGFLLDYYEFIYLFR
jgi:hypothetical protein